MIDIEFPESSVLCEKTPGTANCLCVKPVFHEYKGDNEHLCTCGCTWLASKQPDKYNKHGVVQEIVYERDNSHPHDGTHTGTYTPVSNNVYEDEDYNNEEEDEDEIIDIDYNDDDGLFGIIEEMSGE